MGPTPAKVGRIKARDTQTTSPDPCPLCVNFNQSWHPEVYTNNGLGSVTRIGACFGGLDHRSRCHLWECPLVSRGEGDRLRATSTDRYYLLDHFI